jgi:hypothetical protein
VDQCQVSGLAIRVNAGLVVSALAVCVSWMFSLLLLATARGGASSWSLATKKRSKENAFNHATLGVHSVQFSFIGAPKARCSPEPRMCEPLLLANPDMNTLRPVRSRASTSAREPRRPHAFLWPCFPGGLASWFVVRTNLGVGCPRIARGAPWADSITGGEACGYLCSEKEGFTHPWLWRAPCFWGTYESKLHAVDT